VETAPAIPSVTAVMAISIFFLLMVILHLSPEALGSTGQPTILQRTIF
jgi:hypothetical protein